MREESTDNAKSAVPTGTVYLSAADRQAESFIDDSRWQEAYESSLINNLLFERCIAIPDIFLFISRGQASHVGSAMKAGRTSLLDAAIELGYAVTPFRDTTCQTYAEALEQIRGTGIQGLLPPEVCDRIARRLDGARRRGMESRTYSATYWPDHNLGLEFERRLSKFFDPDGDPETDDPPTDNPRVARIWPQTSEWRKLYFKRTRERGEGQFRRGFYMTELGRSVGLTEEIQDVRQLFYAADTTNQRESMMALCFWLNECYQFSQAVEFGAIPNISNFDSDLTPATLRALISADAGQPSNSQWTERSFEASLPPKNVLLRLDAKQLLSVRAEPAANDYFAALDSWRDNPQSDAVVRDVAIQFESYASAIRKKAYEQSVYDDTIVTLRLSMLDGPNRKLVAATAASAGYGIAQMPVEQTPFILLGGIAYATYIWLRDRPRLGAHTTTAFHEMNVPEIGHA